MLDPTTKPPQNSPYFDPNYTIPRTTDYTPRPTKPSQNHASNGETEEDHGSGQSTPRLWRTSPPRHYRSLSPASKAEAIERGQRELMDMVRTMPEGCFELSLKDLVEKPWARPADHSQNHIDLNLIETFAEKHEIAARKRIDRSSSSNGKIVRSGSRDSNRGGGGGGGGRGGGFLLKMVFPVSARSSKKKKNMEKSNKTSVRSKVSPKPCANRNENDDWWRRKIPILEENQSSTSAKTTSTTRRGRSILPSCCSFIRPKKSKAPLEKRRLQQL